MPRPKIVIVGSGILGAVTAYQLSNKNADVTLIDEADVSGPATPHSFGWINAHTPQNRHHFKMRVEAMALWRQLKAQHPDLPVHFPGALDWDMPSDHLKETVRLYNEFGNSARLLSHAEMRKLAPTANFLPETAIHCPGDGVAVPEEISSAFVSLCNRKNLVQMQGTTVVGLEAKNGRISGVKSSSGMIEADHVVLCMGRKTNEVLASLEISVPLDNRVGILLRTIPLENLQLPIISAPELHFWQMGDGTLLVGENQAGDSDAANIEAFKQRIYDKLSSFLPQCSKIEFTKHSAGIRPMPSDTMPVIGVAGEFKNLHVAVMHSGITLAPIVGRAITKAIIDEKDYKDLKPYAFGRFADIKMQAGV